jgi:membrane protein DedA with SNARE-associated domain
VDSVFAWLTGLPPAALYAALALTAAFENVFPPFPADTVVAFGSFLAARGHGTALGSFLATWLGNVSGAMAMYWAGRRFGGERLMRRLGGSDAARARLEGLYGRHGLWAICLTRLLPGVRALVPPFAGALRLPAGRTMAAMALVSGAWYGAITVLAFRVGASWDQLSARVASWGKAIGLAAVAAAVLAAAWWWLRRRRR